MNGILTMEMDGLARRNPGDDPLDPVNINFSIPRARHAAAEQGAGTAECMAVISSQSAQGSSARWMLGQTKLRSGQLRTSARPAMPPLVSGARDTHRERIERVSA